MSKVIYQDNICFNFVTFLDFLSTKQGLPVVNFCVSRSRSDRDTFVARSGYITARDQSMMLSGVSLKLGSYPRRETAACGRKRCR